MAQTQEHGAPEAGHEPYEATHPRADGATPAGTAGERHGTVRPRSDGEAAAGAHGVTGAHAAHPSHGAHPHIDGEVTVETLLGEALLHGRLLAGAAGVHQAVNWCLPLSEVAPAAPGGLGARPSSHADLTGTAVHLPAAKLTAPEAARALVEDLARRGAAVLFAQPVHGGATDLRAAVRAADAAGLPLVGLPPEGDYRSVGRLVAVKALAGTTHVLEYSVRVHRTLGEVFASGSGLPALAGSMATLARTTVLISDDAGEVLARSGGGDSLCEDRVAELGALLHQWLAEDVLGRESVHPARHAAARERLFDLAGLGPVHVVLAPVSVAGRPYGSVAVVESVVPPDPHDLAQHRVIVEEGAPLVASEMLRLRSVTEAQERARDDFLDSLVHGRFTDVHALEARSRHYRFDTGARHVVFVVAAPGHGALGSPHLLRSLASPRGVVGDAFAMGGVIGELLVVVKGLPEQDTGARFDAEAERSGIERYGAQLRQALREHIDGEVQITYGRGARGAAGVATGYREARIALELSRRLEVPEVCGYERLRVFAAIEEAAAGPQGRAFAHEVLEPLRRVDGQTGDLEQVVLAYINESGNLNAAARRLQLHRNTMLYKLERASRALRMDVRSAETQFTVWLAHRIHILNDSLHTLKAELSPPA